MAAAKGAKINLHLLVEALPALIERDPERVVLPLVVAAARGEHHTAVAQEVQQGKLFRRANGVVARQDNGGRRQLDPCRPCREVGQEDRGHRQAAEEAEVVLRQPD